MDPPIESINRIESSNEPSFPDSNPLINFSLIRVIVSFGITNASALVDTRAAASFLETLFQKTFFHTGSSR